MSTSTANKLTNSKSLLAKLMATENLTVRHIKVQTASFNTQTRVLTCPIWADMDGSLYDLLMGHEVGHALYTHPEILSKAAEGKTPFYRSILNVVEDARIEKLMKRKYPGLRKSFSAGYKDLMERDFFGIRYERELSGKNIADRFNLYFKVGASLMVPFTEEEKNFLDRGEALETYDDVITLTDDIYKHAREEQKAKQQEDTSGLPMPNMESDESEEETEEPFHDDGDFDTSDEEPERGEADDSDEESKESDDAGAAAGDESEEEEKKSDKDEDSAGKGLGEADDEEEKEEKKSHPDNNAQSRPREINKDEMPSDKDDKNDDSLVEPTMETQEQFQRMEHSLLDSQSQSTLSIFLPEPILENIIVDAATVINTYTKSLIDQCANPRKNDPYANHLAFDYNAVARQLTTMFLRKNSKYITLLVKEFEMRKNAAQYSRVKQSRSGVIDTRRLDRYKFTSDIFKKVTTVDKGKNHGMVMFLDLSGSMESIMRETIEQILILVTFCKKVNIPFDVYGFAQYNPIVYKNAAAAVDQDFSDTVVQTKRVAGAQFKYKCKDDVYAARSQSVNNVSPDAEFYMPGSFHLKHMISSNLNGAMYKKAFNMLVTLGEFCRSGRRAPEIRAIVKDFTLNEHSACMNMGGTPLTQAVWASRKIVEKFKKDNHVDIVNAIHLTDGDSTDAVHHACESDRWVNINMVDPITKISVPLPRLKDKNFRWWFGYMNAITHLTSTVTGCRTIGFFVGRREEINKRTTRIERDEEVKKQLRKNLNNNGFTEYKTLGYDTYFFVVTGENTTDEDFVPDVGLSKSKLADAFIKNQNKKVNNRIVGTAFAKYIAE